MGSTNKLPRHRSVWNTEDIDLLGRLRRDKLPVSQIAKHMGRSQEATRSKARQLDMLPKRTRRSPGDELDKPDFPAGLNDAAVDVSADHS